MNSDSLSAGEVLPLPLDEILVHRRWLHSILSGCLSYWVERSALPPLQSHITYPFVNGEAQRVSSGLRDQVMIIKHTIELTLIVTSGRFADKFVPTHEYNTALRHVNRRLPGWHGNRRLLTGHQWSIVDVSTGWEYRRSGTEKRNNQSISHIVI